MSLVAAVFPFFTGYYILNVLASISYVVLKTLHPICEWFFKEGERCELSLSDCEVLVFVGVVLAFKNSKWKKDVNKDVFGMACGFFKAVNLILFLRSDWRLFIVYAVFCTVLFIAVPEPLYTGPDLVQLFNAVSLEEALRENPEVTYLIEFYTVWSPPCKRLAEPFAEVSLKCDSKYLKFGKIDLGRYPAVAQKYNIDDSVASKQLPTLILFQNGKEVKRRPVKSTGRDGKVFPFHFTKGNIAHAFELKSCLEAAKSKVERDEKRVKKEEKKKDK
ncbi:thioredoxin-related transmembrane protein 2-like [Dendronephthya gigantea]|uniref:thioredoxin-related transmembrane protein 2-like n=1 Tax=Dendronephthya gigantea TaxID=151771 RepID=UPI00106AD251|nr:thioredoxin-related transmembrane protein 2-like [Dendronephthya gigantea]